MLPTSRAPLLVDNNREVRNRALDNVISALRGDGVEILYVIGGDGSMKAAHAIATRVEEKYKDIPDGQRFELSVVGVPKAMDNDILWVWQSFGFPSAVEWAKEAVRHLHTEVTSNPRVCVMQLFGSDSGFVICHAALASGVCDLVLIPEVDFDSDSVKKHIKEKLRPRHVEGVNAQSPYAIVLMAETAIPSDIKSRLDKSGLSDDEKKEVSLFLGNNRRVHGQTPDELRDAGLKIVMGIIREAISELEKDDGFWKDFRVFANQPRHLIRAIPPSASDIIYGERLGVLAVDCAMAGYHDFMISQWLTEYVMVPLGLVVLGRKRVPRTGMFWQSVLATTGQPPVMVKSSE